MPRALLPEPPLLRRLGDEADKAPPLGRASRARGCRGRGYPTSLLTSSDPGGLGIAPPVRSAHVAMTPPRGCARGRHGRGQVRSRHRTSPPAGMDSALLSLTCADLGAAEEGEDGGAAGYVKGDHCLDNLKDLQRLLRRDDPERREVFKQVCKWKIASRDLVPIIENYQADRNLVITAGSRHAVLLFVRCWSAPRDALCALVDVVCHQLRRKNWQTQNFFEEHY